jgi:hypothetical protein
VHLPSKEAESPVHHTVKMRWRQKIANVIRRNAKHSDAEDTELLFSKDYQSTKSFCSEESASSESSSTSRDEKPLPIYSPLVSSASPVRGNPNKRRRVSWGDSIPRTTQSSKSNRSTQERPSTDSFPGNIQTVHRHPRRRACTLLHTTPRRPEKGTRPPLARLMDCRNRSQGQRSCPADALGCLSEHQPIQLPPRAELLHKVGAHGFRPPDSTSLPLASAKGRLHHGRGLWIIQH